MATEWKMMDAQRSKQERKKRTFVCACACVSDARFGVLCALKKNGAKKKVGPPEKRTCMKKLRASSIGSFYSYRSGNTHKYLGVNGKSFWIPEIRAM